MQWGIFALHNPGVRKGVCSYRLLEVVGSTIGVNQGCSLSSTLFSLYIDEVCNYIKRFGGSGACFARIAILTLLNFNGIVLISNSPKELQRHLDALKSFCITKDLPVNLDITEGIDDV